MSAQTSALYVVPDNRIPLTFRYTRLSSDPGGKREDHVTQNRHVDSVILQRQLPPARPEHCFADDDTSASKETVVRDEWDRMLKVLAGVDRRKFEPYVIASAQDRLTRRLGNLDEIADVIERKQGHLITYAERDIDCREGSRSGLYFSGVMSRQEAGKITGRTREGVLTAAMDGKRHGPVAFGWRFEGTVDARGKVLGRDVVDEDAKREILAMADAILRGKSLGSIATDLNARGIPAPGAGHLLDKATGRRADALWNAQKVRQILLRKANIGTRTHTPGYVEDPDTAEYHAAYPALMDEALWQKVRAVLDDPARRTVVSTAPTHWLSGIARCGICGETVTAQKCKGKGKSVPYAVYRCRASHVSRHKAKVDAHVEMVLLETLTRPSVRALLLGGLGEAEESAAAEVLALRARQANLMSMWDRGELSDAQFGPRNKRFLAEIKRAESALTARRDVAVYAPLLSAADVEGAWHAMSLDERRSIVAILFTVTLHKSLRTGRSAFDASTIDVQLRQVDDGA